ncbi:transcriptional regulator, LacI family [Sporobacter termitidis DSM 10068]|uniref:Transcriptional regulator, LacI family n=1 Tax=Sporobacter termitidis DSM 10068 TaxID=1123282 RepID=A0A1M5XBE2_9FIRM|nr:LacI family DNA-binding transcriptional regulator [Sporobacter termitidis]SHH97059.1 transcriptional regulator, LacI family [Sporobacter termitidis DSM 10068]
MANIRDVATLAKVSPATVSIVLNHRAQERGIPPVTQKAVMDAAAALHYSLRKAPRHLRLADNAITLCIYVEMDYSSNFLLRMLNGIRSQMTENEIELNTLISPFIKNRLSDKLPLQNNHTMHAAIIAAPYAKDVEYLENNRIGIPFVLYNRPSQTCNTVEIDNYGVGRQAAEHLAERGVKTVGIVSAIPSYPVIRTRNEGFTETCALNGIDFLPKFRITADNSESGGFEAGERLAAMSGRPRALFCDSDAIARGLVFSLTRHGIRIPEDMGVVCVGMGDPKSLSYMTPSLTTVDIPHEEMSAQSVQMLLGIIQNKVSGVSHVMSESRLLVRESSPAPEAAAF